MQNPARDPLIALVLIVASAVAVDAAPYPREQMAVVLFPIASRPVSGAFGSVWWAELRVHNPGDEAVPFHQGAGFCVINECREEVASHHTKVLEMGGRRLPAQGQLAYVDRDMVRQLVFSYQTWLSKDGRARPVAEVPVVGEEQFFLERGVLPHVPIEEASRIMLRIYDVEPNSGNFVRMKVFPAFAGTSIREPIVDEIHMFNYEGVGVGDRFLFPEWPGYIQLDNLAGRYPALLGYEAIRIELERVDGESGLAFWFFATLTDNETQSVTNYTPNIAH